MTTNKTFFQALEEIRTIRWEMNSMAHGFRLVHLDPIADELKALSERLDAVVDRLTEDHEAETPKRDDPMSIMLLKSIKNEARARR